MSQMTNVMSRHNMIFSTKQSNAMSDDIKGDHETQESEGGEADLHKYSTGCKKNPGHRQFIPVNKFTLGHLPESLQDNDLYEYIKVSADLTVRIVVELVSPQRPKFWPKTSQPYPFYNVSNTKVLRTGSGRVCYIKKYQDEDRQGLGLTNNKKCWCRKCQETDSPSNEWWEFIVTTATHVVFDDIEARHTTLRFFYDSNDSPVLNVDMLCIDYINIEYDSSRLKCVTCDKTLGNKLMEIRKHYTNVLEKVFEKYVISRSKHKLNFIVSHPHGCSKQVSIGQWTEKQEMGDKCKFTYTTCTCPGSSGARVHCVGYNDWWYDHVHSGSLKSGLNYSGVGYFESFTW